MGVGPSQARHHATGDASSPTEFEERSTKHVTRGSARAWLDVTGHNTKRTPLPAVNGPDIRLSEPSGVGLRFQKERTQQR
jgi:hypothetical protein